MLTWNVYVGDPNSKEIKVHNIFNHTGFMYDCGQAAKKYLKDHDLEELIKRIKHSLMYYYWAKCEWEIIIDHWPSSEKLKSKKVSAYDQIMLNWDHFIDYILNNLEELKEEKWKK